MGPPGPTTPRTENGPTREGELGPTGLGIVEDTEQLELLAEIGIALLLFVVGLKLDLHLIRTVVLVGYKD